MRTEPITYKFCKSAGTPDFRLLFSRRNYRLRERRWTHCSAPVKTTTTAGNCVSRCRYDDRIAFIRWTSGEKASSRTDIRPASSIFRFSSSSMRRVRLYCRLALLEKEWTCPKGKPISLGRVSTIGFLAQNAPKLHF